MPSFLGKSNPDRPKSIWQSRTDLDICGYLEFLKNPPPDTEFPVTDDQRIWNQEVFAYDPLGRLRAYFPNFEHSDGYWRKHSHHWDYDDEEGIVSYTHSDRGRGSQILNTRSDRFYDSLGRVYATSVLQDYDSGVTSADLTTYYTYNSLGLITEASTGPLDETLSKQFFPDSAKSITTNEYDVLGRLLKRSLAKSVNIQGEVQVPGDEIDHTYQYDVLGRLTQAKDGVTYNLKWDARDRLRQVWDENGGGIISEYRYWPDMTLAGTTAFNGEGTGDDVVERHYGFGMSVHETYVFAGDVETLTEEVIYEGLDRPVLLRQYDGETRTDYGLLANVRGDIMAVVSSSGEVVQRYSYSPFGERTVLDAEGEPYPVEEPALAALSRFGHGGTWHDALSGLVWMRHRWYAPAMRRFLSPDPLEDDALGNDYAPFGNSPFDFTDPWGLADKPGPVRGWGDWFYQNTLQPAVEATLDAATHGLLADVAKEQGQADKAREHRKLAREATARAAYENFQLGMTLVPGAGTGVGAGTRVAKVAAGIADNLGMAALEDGLAAIGAPDWSMDAVGALRSAVSGRGSSKPHASAMHGENPPSRAGKPFTKKGKEEVKRANAEKFGGKNICENCGIETIPAQQGKSGVSPQLNETNVDHVVPRSKGGSGDPSNGQILCRECNLEKGAQ